LPPNGRTTRSKVSPNGTPVESYGSGIKPSSAVPRDATKPSALITGTTTTRSLFSRFVIWVSLP
jgi:hypothetical protein